MIRRLHKCALHDERTTSIFADILLFRRSVRQRIRIELDGLIASLLGRKLKLAPVPVREPQVIIRRRGRSS